MTSWSFLTSHGRVLLCISRDPETRLRDIALTLDITERRVHGIVTDLVEAGYIVKVKDGRRNRYRIRTDLPLPEPIGGERTIGQLLELLAGADRGGGQRSVQIRGTAEAVVTPRKRLTTRGATVLPR
jgi:hypothetical protein